MTQFQVRPPDGHDWIMVSMTYHQSMLGIYKDLNQVYHTASVEAGNVFNQFMLPSYWQSMWGGVNNAHTIMDYGIGTSLSSDTLYVPTAASGGQCGALYELRTLHDAGHSLLGGDACVIATLRLDSNGDMVALTIPNGCETCAPSIHKVVPASSIGTFSEGGAFSFNKVCVAQGGSSWWLSGQRGNHAVFVPAGGYAAAGNMNVLPGSGDWIAYVGVSGSGSNWGTRVLAAMHETTCEFRNVQLPEEVGNAVADDWCMGERGIWMETTTGVLTPDPKLSLANAPSSGSNAGTGGFTTTTPMGVQPTSTSTSTLSSQDGSQPTTASAGTAGSTAAPTTAGPTTAPLDNTVTSTLLPVAAVGASAEDGGDDNTGLVIGLSVTAVSLICCCCVGFLCRDRLCGDNNYEGASFSGNGGGWGMPTLFGNRGYSSG